MYERMLDKKNRPSVEDMAAFCGENSKGFTQLNQWLKDSFATEQAVVFPYGNHYGWGTAHRIKKRLVCNVFPEDGAFTLMLRLSDAQFAAVYDQLPEYARDYVDHKYPCGDGGWIHYRITCPEHLPAAQTMLAAKLGNHSHGTAKGDL